jgi:hypothetical protein
MSIATAPNPPAPIHRVPLERYASDLSHISIIIPTYNTQNRKE